MVYIREIHPTDGWHLDQNLDDGVEVRHHRSIEERVSVGQACMLRMALEIPAVVDEMDDAVAEVYGAIPERLYLVGTDGRVAYKGGIGPFQFRPAQWEQAIADYLECD